MSARIIFQWYTGGSGRVNAGKKKYTKLTKVSIISSSIVAQLLKYTSVLLF